MSTDLYLGQRVIFDQVLRRTEEQRKSPNGFRTDHWRVWQEVPLHRFLFLPEPLSLTGIVVGMRTLMNVRREYDYEYGWDNDLSTSERFQAAWVAFDLRRKPVWVLPEHLNVEGP